MLAFRHVDDRDQEVSVDAQMEESGPDPEDGDEVQDLPITLADGNQIHTPMTQKITQIENPRDSASFVSSTNAGKSCGWDQRQLF
jgi:hypothetical protein